jgi:regulator of nucleoside diphosphate kinase
MPSPAVTSARPPIIISETDADRLYLLAERAADRAAALLEELERARVSPDRRVPADVVGMNSTVDFVDEARGEPRTVQLVYPADADIEAGKVSVLTPVGAALIGLREGQSIRWPDREGRARELRVLKVRRAPISTHG